MTDTGPIIVATDLSEPGRRAVNLGLACAEGMHWPLCLLHVIDLARDAVPVTVPPAILPAVEAMQAMVRRRTELAAKELEVERQRCLGWSGARCETRLAEGYPWETIVAEATERHAPLVVVSSHSRARAHALRGSVKERLLGSTADRVVRHAPCPVLVAPAEIDLPRSLAGARWLVAIDFHEPSVEALRIARLFAERTGGTLETLHVVRREEVDPNEAWRSSLHGHAREVAMRRLAELGAAELERTPGTTFRMTERVADGDEADMLVAAAHERPNTVLVLGTHGRGGLARLALGSTTERVLRRADVPVLCVRAIDAAHP